MVDLEKRDKGNDDNLKRKPHGFDAVLGILKNIYEGIRVKLLKVAHIEDVSQEEGVDEKTSTEIREQYQYVFFFKQKTAYEITV